MIRLAAIGLALGAALGLGPVSDMDRIFFNARLAQREGRSLEVLKLWMLRNQLVSRDASSEPRGGDFRSVVWAALATQGVCPDGFPPDASEGAASGAGLWPLALHNWFVLQQKQAPQESKSPYQGFSEGRQRRRVSLGDVVDTEELRSLTFPRGDCGFPRRLLARYPGASTETLLQHLLEQAQGTLDRTKVEHLSVLQTRLFQLGPPELDASKRSFLQGALRWPLADWLALSRPNRLFVFTQARAYSEDDVALDRLMLDLLDERLKAGSGDEVESWLALWSPGAVPSMERRARIVSGERGARLLELASFKERGVIALHRGVFAFQENDRGEALRSFSFAMAHGGESRAAGVTVGLARRWFSYLLSRYETTDDLLQTLRASTPRGAYNAAIADLYWRAALRGDGRSFEKVAASAYPDKAVALDLARLRPLAQGNTESFLQSLSGGDALAFQEKVVSRIEREEVAIRRAHRSLLQKMIEMLDGITGDPERVAALRERMLSVLERGQESFVGSLRLAPTDPLPWPFPEPEVGMPSPIAPIAIVPVEWSDGAGKRVFGWRLAE